MSIFIKYYSTNLELTSHQKYMMQSGFAAPRADASRLPGSGRSATNLGEAGANAGRRNVAIVNGANAIVRAHGGIGRAQRGQPRQCRLDVERPRVEMAAVCAGAGERRHHCPSRVQNSPNTWVDSTKPSATLTATPAVNAKNGRAPTAANSRTF